MRKLDGCESKPWWPSDHPKSLQINIHWKHKHSCMERELLDLGYSIANNSLPKPKPSLDWVSGRLPISYPVDIQQKSRLNLHKIFRTPHMEYSIWSDFTKQRVDRSRGLIATGRGQGSESISFAWETTLQSGIFQFFHSFVFIILGWSTSNPCPWTPLHALQIYTEARPTCKWHT